MKIHDAFIEKNLCMSVQIFVKLEPKNHMSFLIVFLVIVCYFIEINKIGKSFNN